MSITLSDSAAARVNAFWRTAVKVWLRGRKNLRLLGYGLCTGVC